MKKLNNSAPSGVSYTEDWLPIRQIMNGMIQLDDGSYVTGVKVAPKNIFIMNFGYLLQIDQLILMYIYLNYNLCIIMPLLMRLESLLCKI